jgi:hypothetical protein
MTNKENFIYNEGDGTEVYDTLKLTGNEKLDKEKIALSRKKAEKQQDLEHARSLYLLGLGPNPDAQTIRNEQIAQKQEPKIYKFPKSKPEETPKEKAA